MYNVMKALLLLFALVGVNLDVLAQSKTVFEVTGISKHKIEIDYFVFITYTKKSEIPQEDNVRNVASPIIETITQTFTAQEIYLESRNSFLTQVEDSISKRIEFDEVGGCTGGPAIIDFKNKNIGCAN
jgi:hypothetical protein